ncbi:MAG: murein biosynthesis integral membrane protein MurJ [Defluviitaleaceae bacterium]|nr:murein biosynthesis integral membrane protein MurJ [Defluviitaleaceae bacterium]MCL2836907.1 murein biosynthesis integral membrane protein MurJ [Defluviitaleaceae bacterium]
MEKTQHKSGNNKQAKNILSVMLIMSAGKLAGLFREILIGGRYGTGSVESEAFGYAAQFPNTFLDVFFASAFTASFIPIFNAHLEKRGKKAAFELANSFITLTFSITAAVTAVLLIGTPVIMRVILYFAGETAFSNEIHTLATPLLRLMFPTIMLSGAAFSITGILQAMEEFNAPAAMSLVSNILIIIYLIFFIDSLGIFGLAAVFLLGWATQIFIQLPALRKKGFRFRPRLNLKNPEIKSGLKDIGKLMLPVMVSSWAFPVNLMVNASIAGRVAGVAALRFAYTIYSVLTGIIVLSFTNVMFTRFSKLSASDRTDELGESISASARGVLFFLLPLSAALFVLAPAAIRIIYERGAFTAESTAVTGAALRFFALGMAGFGLYNILNRGFYARREAKIPLAASLAAIAVNAALSLLLVDRLGAGGPALALSISITTASLILFVSSSRKKILRLNRSFFADLIKMLFLSVITGLIIAVTNDFMLSILLAGGKAAAVLAAGTAGIFGMIWYFWGAGFLRIREAEMLKKLLNGRVKGRAPLAGGFGDGVPQGLNILMVTMSLNIGGAETHILELCRALRRRGVNVCAASSGGKYAEELVSCGIPHYTVPLSRKRPWSVLTAYFTLKRIIRENGINIVHAHARIPAFICGFVCRKMKARFVTTAHWVFNTKFPYNLLSDWGQASLAVSESIKDYLIENYGYEPGRIIVTTNGIDTDKFRPETDGGELLTEFGLDPAKKRIVSLSRLDGWRNPANPDTVRAGAFLAALGLINAAPDLENARPGELEIIIVGSGDSFNEITEAAAAANKAVGRKMVITAGSRTDVNRFLGRDVTDLFVNVSRSALEAMAAERPVILAGNEGYMGLLTPELLEEAAESNFCCRGGYPQTSKELLVKDILAALDLSDEELAKIGACGREFVKNNYSVERMTDDALELYGIVSRPMKRYDAVLSGYYGTGNSGDNMILSSIIDAIKREVPGARIAVLCRNPEVTAAAYGVKTIWMFNFFRIYGALKRANLLISGGGTLLQDNSSTKSLLYYLSVVNLARKLGCKTMIYASGLGPFKNNKNRERAARTLRRVDLITLRDELSLDEIAKMNTADIKAAVTADAVFGLTHNEIPAQPVLDELGLGGKEFFCVAIRGWKSLPPDFAEILARFVDYMHDRYNLTALFIIMQHSEDMDISKQVKTASRAGGVLLTRNLSADETFAVISNARFVAAMRLHAIIYAAKMGVPVIGLSYDPKVYGMAKIFSQAYCVDVENVTTEALIGFADDVIAKRDSISERLLDISAGLVGKAAQTAKMAGDIINRRDI